MINKIRTEKLKTSVKDYVAKSFTQKITLYTTLKINWDSSLGSFYTFVPESVSSEKLMNPVHSILMHQDKEKTEESNMVEFSSNQFDDLIVDKICHILQTSNTYCLIPDFLSTPTEANGKDISIDEQLKQKLIFFNHEVYYLFDTKDKKENIKKAIKLTSSYYPMGMGIIFHIEDIKYYLTQQEIQKEEFFNVAIGNLQFLFIQAYDNESYIFWKNEKS